MKEHGMIFSGDSVRAILEGRKTMTRRVLKPQPERLGWNEGWFHKGGYWSHPKRKYHPGDLIWVREGWCLPGEPHYRNPGTVLYKADNGEAESEITKAKAWRSPLFMPRWASRITLKVKSTRFERVQEITEEDAEREGVPSYWNFAETWNSINGTTGPKSWEANPWVVVIEFAREEG
ncbi:MAG: morphogenetic protein [Nitrospinaceae bacterium]